MHVYTSVLILLVLLVVLPDLYLYNRFMRNRTNHSTSILHGIISIYFIIVSLAIMLNINNIYSTDTSYRLIMFITVLGAVYIPKLIFCTFDLLFFLTKKRWRWIQRLGYVAAFIAILSILHSVAYERFNFKKRDVAIEIENLPSAFENYKIIQISDMHLGSFGLSQKRLIPLMDSINAQNPDLIVFTGDMINNFATECNNWSEIFNRLNSSTNKLAVLGNHDYSIYFKWENEDLRSMNSMAVRQKIRDFGFKLLLNESQIIHKENDSIAIIGIGNWGRRPSSRHADIDKAIIGTQNIDTKILLSHDPTFWKDSICGIYDIDLTLSGHTHAAQTGIDLGKWKISPAKILFEYWDGLYEHNNQKLLVSRGIGCVGIPARIGMGPLYEVITLKKKQP